MREASGRSTDCERDGKIEYIMDLLQKGLIKTIGKGIEVGYVCILSQLLIKNG